MKRYETIAAFESALRARLRDLATKEKTFQDLRKQVAFDRVLARLQEVAPEAWLLKGGLALEYRVARARTTMDIDISTELTLDEISDVLARAAALPLDDYFQIEVGERERPVEEIETYRFNITVRYADGRRFEQLKLDVGLADPWLGTPITVETPALLAFAGIKPTTVRVIPTEQHLAEKIHAYTKSYGAHPSSRVKDLIDMALLLQNGVDRELLRTTLQTIFEARHTHEVPATLLSPPEYWRVPYRKLASNLAVQRELDDGYAFVANELTPVLASFHARRALEAVDD